VLAYWYFGEHEMRVEGLKWDTRKWLMHESFLDWETALEQRPFHFCGTCHLVFSITWESFTWVTHEWFFLLEFMEIVHVYR
jgi:hypothetical protein